MANGNILIMGTGAIVGTHIAAAERFAPHHRLHAWDPNPAALAAVVAAHPRVQPHAEAAQLLDLPVGEQDLVIVASPPFAHLENACAALASGRPVLIEKPLLRDYGEGHHLVAAARAAGQRIACCGSRFVGRSSCAALVSLLEGGAIGALRHIHWRTRWFKGRPVYDNKDAAPWMLQQAKAGGGILMDWGPYDMAALHAVLRPVSVRVRAAHCDRVDTTDPDQAGIVQDVENIAQAWLDYRLADGRVVPVHFERCNHHHDPDLGQRWNDHRFEGSTGVAVWDWFPGDRVVVQRESGGAYERSEQAFNDSFDLVMDYPLVSFLGVLDGTVDARSACADHYALFDHAVLMGIAQVATGHEPTTVSLEDWQ